MAQHDVAATGSGYRHEFETYCAAATSTRRKAPPRTEVLWTNYVPPASGPLLAAPSDEG